MYSLGIDIGYSSIKTTLIDEENIITYSEYKLHRGKIKEVLKKSIKKISTRYNPKNITYGAVTGSGTSFLHQNSEIIHVNEVAATIEGCLNTCPEAQSIIEIGGENAKYITGFNAENKCIQTSMNPSCSAGTGSFLEEQLSRLNLELEDYTRLCMEAESIPRIAGRCSVFAKTDIIHHQQEGVPVPDILLGLAYSVVRNYRGAVIKRMPVTPPVLFVGGVAYNEAITKALKEILRLDDSELMAPMGFETVCALGCALIASREKHRLSVDELLRLVDENQNTVIEEVVYPSLADYEDDGVKEKHVCTPITGELLVECHLGVDVGSTTTKLVLIDERDNVLGYQYLRTHGKPLETVQRGLDVFKEQFSDKVQIMGVGATGSGRYLVADYIGADTVVDEITAQAKGARAVDGDVDTIFEIGGQDSKYIYLRDGVVTDFQMNKICAAGTGSFIEEQAKKLLIPLEKFSQLALSSKKPTNLGERCTVFIGTSVAYKISEGEPVADIAAGLCYSIVKNYLNRVVGNKKIGKKVFLQGGIAYNQGVINAFKAMIGDKLIVPPFFSVTGAIGAALLAREETKDTTNFKGYRLDEATKIQQVKEKPTSKYNEMVEALIFEDYTGEIDPTQKTVGVPRALFTFGMYPMFSAFFRELGLNVLLSDPTSEETIRRGQEYITDETCFPVKLVNGHVAELVERGVDYIFFPDLYTVEHHGSHTRQNYGCPYMQLAFKMIYHTMELDEKGITLLAPTIAYNQGPEFMKKTFIEIGVQLGKSPEESVKALMKGGAAYKMFEERLERHAEKTLESINGDEDAFVLVSKIYGIADPVLNMGIPGKLEKMGYKVIPFFDLPETDISEMHPNMYWPFGVHILEAAELVSQNKNMHAIFLTHHGCGPDAIMAHYFQEIMNGKPYLNIEVDEHSSKVGVITRVEAFINSLKNKKENGRENQWSKPWFHVDWSELEEDTTLLIPYLYPYSQIFQKILEQKGVKAKILPEPSTAVIEQGRQHILTSEYFSVTALLGMIFKEITGNATKTALYLPQNEGAEMDGQVSRLVWTKLHQHKHHELQIVSPYVEDMVYYEPLKFQLITEAMVLGDIINVTPASVREKALEKVVKLIEQDMSDHESIIRFAEWVKNNPHEDKGEKKILAVGENLILYNKHLNNNIFEKVEENGHRLVYSPLAEAMWTYWRDYVDHNPRETQQHAEKNLKTLEKMIHRVSKTLGELTPYEKNLGKLLEAADSIVGYYAGANGRYRAAKLVCSKQKTSGAIMVSSLYENTGIALNTIKRGIDKLGAPPTLNLTFDGTPNEKDQIKVESFLLYL